MSSRVLENRCAIITGASQGLGFAIARRYLEEGANVLICARGEVLLERASAELQRAALPGQRVVSITADVSRADEVSRLVETARREFDRVHVLVSNAAIAGPSGPVESADWGEWVRALEINLLGPVLLSRALLPHFKQAGYGKIIQVSGGGATSPLPMLSAYAASKAAVVRFAETLAEETRPHRIDVNAISPGVLNTRMLDEFIAAGAERIGHQFHARAVQWKREGGVPLSKGSDLAVFLASAASDGITGKLLSAVWDPWETLPEHLQELNGTDVYTLRRIVPEDRGLPWRKED
jgi:NAD(P)-dependent dehydrogenase (short-subunit alcohol dehydrogenase family)